jgi:hypothetical protein
MGTLLQNSAYGSAIPVVYGQTLSVLLAIWAANLRQGGGNIKKFKQIKKGITNYCENIDFLLGHTPIMGVLQMAYNSGWFPLNFTSQSFTSAGGRQTFTVTDPNFYFVTAVTVEGSYSFPVNDFGGQGPSTLTGTFEIPLWNELETGPDPTNPMSYRAFPYCYRWQPGFGAEVFVDAEAFPTGTLKVYYAAVTPASSNVPPITHLDMVFESELGNGPEYADAPSPFPAQQIIYPHFAGLGSSELNLGASGALPSMQPEVRGKWGIYTAGDGDFVDMIEDVFKSGMAQAAIGSATANTQMERGLSSYDLPGTVQKKVDQNGSVALPPMLYDMPNAVGNYLVAVAVAAGTLSISSSAGDTWTPVFGDNLGYQVWTAPAVGGQNTVTIAGSSGRWNTAIIEVGGPGGSAAALALDSVVPNVPEGSGEMTKKGMSSTGPFLGINALCYDFGLWSAIPTGAAIQGIYPVYVGDALSYNTTFYGGGPLVPPATPQAATPPVTAVGANPGITSASNGALSGIFNALITSATPVIVGRGVLVSGQWNPAPNLLDPLGIQSIGTSLSDLTGQIIAIGVTNSGNTNPGGAYDGQKVSGLGFIFAGFAVYYTDPLLPNPLLPGINNGNGPLPVAIPAGMSVAWAIPGVIVSNIPGGSPGYGTSTLPGGQVLPLPPYTEGSVPDVPSLTTPPAPISIGSTVQQGFPGYLLSIPLYLTPTAPATLAVPLWKPGAPANVFGSIQPNFQLQYRNIYSPGAYPFPLPSPTPDAIALLSFKYTNPVPWPRPLGDYIDIPSFDLVRQQCRAGGLWGSLAMTSQTAASDWIKSLAAAADAAPVFLGAKLFLYPYSEVSAAGNGALYTAPTAAGPIFALSDLNGDYVGSNGSPVLTPADRINLPNVLQMQCMERTANYNQVTIQTPDPASIGLYGERKADAITNMAVQDSSVARTLLGIMVRRNQYGGDSWAFTASARWSLLSPMDLGTLTDTLQGLVNAPIRITSYNEKDDGSFEGTAEPFVYGMCAPSALAAVPPAQNPLSTNISAGDINPPIIFEPTSELYPSLTGEQLWCVVSSASAQFGGCQVFVSTDGGASYNAAPGFVDGDSNVITGSAVTGRLTADWPADTDPDSTNDLAVDVTESDGVIESVGLTTENNFELPCYVEGDAFGLQVNGTDAGSGEPLELDVNGTAVAEIGGLQINGADVASDDSDGFGYELMSYAVATLTGANLYTLKATGAGNYLRRSIFNAPSSVGAGIDHEIGSRFAVINPTAVGTLKMSLPAVYIGQELFFKFLSFNTFGSALQSLSDVPAYSYTPTGVPGSV